MDKYIKSAKYDKGWVEENWMGPHPLWLVEDICSHLDLRPGMKVLDMGCGKGLTSVFLAKEYGVTVFANDLWISATDNLKRFEEAGVADKVFPIHAEAHTLPYAEGFFDAAISIDSYHYYGTSESYLPGVFAKLVKPGGQLAIVVPGLVREFDKGYPDTLEKHWDSELYTFHSKDWWRRLWEKTGTVEIKACYEIKDPKAIWYPWAKWARENLKFNDDDFLDADINNDIALIALTAVKKQ
ncbi:MAG: methyltransferase domain-containing protein [Defluviitaleaceae bacterium]|nr:methyltransferase domain-containing protein [Defluviitaleaceae bacterium]